MQNSIHSKAVYLLFLSGKSGKIALLELPESDTETDTSKTRTLSIRGS